MFQDFTAATSPENGPERLARLRTEMQREGLDAYIVPRTDAYQGEYVAPCDERLAWLTGFTGSAGFCVATQNEAAVFADGRYTVQVRQQIDPEAFTPVAWPATTVGAWLAEHVATGNVGFDPWLHTVAEVRQLKSVLEKIGAEVVATQNLVDRIWEDRPAPPTDPFFAYPDDLAGETSHDKRTRIAQGLKEAGQSTAILTLPDSIAWLLNIRGSDIERNPVPQSFALLHNDGRAEIFAPDGKADALSTHLGADVSISSQDDFLSAVSQLEGTVLIDPASCPQIVADALTCDIAEGKDPCILPKGIKNATEIANTTEAHLRDGAAMCRFLHWLDENSPSGSLTEIDVVKNLERFRRETNKLLDISFDTISGAGPNGAIVHYRVTEGSNRTITPGDIMLVDSGGQYLDGTTDITRTMATGPVSEEIKACFTRVLQGMIGVSLARFPKGVTGRDLDAIARYPLWQAGMDYDHGTGHGVGVFLCVHEGPQSISRRETQNALALQPGMILSNEPGYYCEGEFGIRIENLIVVVEAPKLAGADDREMLSFENLTYVPIDRRLIQKDMLTAAERHWIDTYHADTLSRIGPRIEEPEVKAWLEAACAPL